MTCVQLQLPPIEFLAELPGFAVDNFLFPCINDCYNVDLDLASFFGLYGIESTSEFLLESPGVGNVLQMLIDSLTGPVLYIVEIVCLLLRLELPTFNFDWNFFFRFALPNLKLRLPPFSLELPDFTLPSLGLEIPIPTINLDFGLDFDFDIPFPDLSWIIQLIALLLYLPMYLLDWLIVQLLCPGIEMPDFGIDLVLEWVKAILQPIAFPDLPDISIDAMIEALPWLCVIKCLLGKLITPIGAALGPLLDIIATLPGLLEDAFPGIIDDCGCILPLVALFPNFVKPCD